jgi:hypothetical protein
MTSSIEALPTSALAFASTRVPIADVGESVGDVRDRLVGGERLESAAQIDLFRSGNPRVFLSGPRRVLA